MTGLAVFNGNTQNRRCSNGGCSNDPFNAEVKNNRASCQALYDEKVRGTTSDRQKWKDELE